MKVCVFLHQLKKQFKTHLPQLRRLLMRNSKLGRFASKREFKPHQRSGNNLNLNQVVIQTEEVSNWMHTTLSLVPRVTSKVFF